MLEDSKEICFYFALFKNMMLDVVSKNVILSQYKAIAPSPTQGAIAYLLSAIQFSAVRIEFFYEGS
jgi:hypothetical protein